MRPLWRWTICDVAKLGWEIFIESVRHAPKVYPEFDFVICYNNLMEDRLASLQKYSIPLLAQDESMSVVPHYEVKVCKDFAWKIIPPRLRIEAHELWVDNDLVIRDRIPAIDDWLAINTGIISKGFSSCYGRFADKIDPDVDCCAGFFGLPPHFDFGAWIIEACKGEPLVEFDEQGLVVYTVSKLPDFIVVPYFNLRMWGHWQSEFNSSFPEGIHFCGANRTDQLRSWDYYRATSMP